MYINFTERILVIAKRRGILVSQIAKSLGMSRQNFDKRSKRNSWTESEMYRLAEAVGCSAEILLRDSASGEEL